MQSQKIRWRHTTRRAYMPLQPVLVGRFLNQLKLAYLSFHVFLSSPLRTHQPTSCKFCLASFHGFYSFFSRHANACSLSKLYDLLLVNVNCNLYFKIQMFTFIIWIECRKVLSNVNETFLFLSMSVSKLIHICHVNLGGQNLPPSHFRHPWLWFISNNFLTK